MHQCRLADHGSFHQGFTVPRQHPTEQIRDVLTVFLCATEDETGMFRDDFRHQVRDVIRVQTLLIRSTLLKK